MTSPRTSALRVRTTSPLTTGEELRISRALVKWSQSLHLPTHRRPTFCYFRDGNATGLNMMVTFYPFLTGDWVVRRAVSEVIDDEVDKRHVGRYIVLALESLLIFRRRPSWRLTVNWAQN